ncbi:hypothetical protein HDV00_003406 [Rhizophlyctis rosea]|nr:hypothetical protein HDV00_003406 [Rhizophlyctis rosea]
MAAMRLVVSDSCEEDRRYGRECLEVLVWEMADGAIDWRPTWDTVLKWKEEVGRGWFRKKGVKGGEERKRVLRELVEWMNGVFVEARKRVTVRKKKSEEGSKEMLVERVGDGTVEVEGKESNGQEVPVNVKELQVLRRN